MKDNSEEEKNNNEVEVIFYKFPSDVFNYMLDYMVEKKWHPVDSVLSTLNACKVIYATMLSNFLIPNEDNKEQFELNKKFVLARHREIIESLNEYTEEIIKKSEDRENGHAEDLVKRSKKDGKKRN
jgi:hypothetical protein